MGVIHVHPEVYVALVKHRDGLSRAPNREVGFDEVVLDLLDRFRSDTRPTAPDDPTAHSAPNEATGTPDGQQQPPP